MRIPLFKLSGKEMFDIIIVIARTVPRIAVAFYKDEALFFE